MPQERMSREEAVQYLTMQQDKMEDIKRAGITGTFVSNPGVAAVLELLEETGIKVGYAPAFRCLVKGLSPEESIRWGK